MNFLDDQSVTLTCDFPYSEVESDQPGAESDSDRTEAIQMALELQRRIWAWVWQAPCDDLEGFKCRSIIAAWIFVPQLRSYTMTEIAGRCGLKKQSLGRWIEPFKRTFPMLANLEHLRNGKTHERTTANHQ